MYIYFTLKDVIEATGVGKNKAVQVFAQMETLGLIVRKKQGQGKPARIFVRNIIEQSVNEQPDTPEETAEPLPERNQELEEVCAIPSVESEESDAAPVAEAEVAPSMEAVSDQEPEPTPDQIPSADEPVTPPANNDACIERFDTFGDHCAQMDHPRAAQTSRYETPRGLKTGSQDFPKVNPIYNKKIKTECIYNPSIFPDTPMDSRRPPQDPEGMMMDRFDVRERIRENIDYSILMEEHPGDMEQIDWYVDLMVQTYCSSKPTVRINSEDYPLWEVRECLENLDRMHLLYVLECMRNNTTRVRNIRAYTLTALFNAPATMDAYYEMRVRHDMEAGCA